jgi:hypothetical protein
MQMQVRVESFRLRVLIMAVFVAVSSQALVAATPATQLQGNTAVHKARVVESYGKLPLSFEANQGQADKRVKFMSRGSGYGLYLTGEDAVLTLHQGDCEGRSAVTNLGQDASLARRPGHRPIDPGCTHHKDVVRMRLTGCTGGAADPVGEEPLQGTANYFIGSDPAEWHTGVPTYAKVRYSQVYPGVDLVYYGNQRQLEYDFVVAPGTDPKLILLQFVGAKGLQLSANGDLVVTATNGALSFHGPVAYQVADGKMKSVRSRFELLAKNTVGFRLESYDRGQPLVIDPVLSYSTYLGGSGYDAVGAIAVDGTGNVYLTGETGSTDFPVTKGAFQSTIGGTYGTYNAFVTKLNQSGSALLYSTYLGGSGADSGTGLALDSSGNVYVTGYTSSYDFPVTPGAFQATNHNGFDRHNAFVTKLNSTGTKLVYSTYLGGGGNSESPGDGANGIAVDHSENAYITGDTTSNDFPVTKDAFQTTSNPWANAFITKLNPAGSGLVYSTYLSGSGACYGDSGGCYGDIAYALAVDDSGSAYVAGQAFSYDFPVTPGAFQMKYAGVSDDGNGFVSKLDSTGTSLVYSTYLGGSNRDGANALALDREGDAYVTGSASSKDFPVTKGAFQTTNKACEDCTNAFVTKLNTVGSALIYSTYVGGSGGDSAFGLGVDPMGNAYIAGTSFSTNFPVTPGAFQPTNHAAKGSNAFVTMLNPAGSKAFYSTYLGGSDSDGASSVAKGANGRVFVAGTALSTDFPVTQGAFQTANPGSYSGYVSKLDLSGITTTSLTSSADPGVAGTTTMFTAEVAAADVSTVPTGSMVFRLDGKTTITKALSAGKAVFATSSLAVGKHTLVATYDGSTSFSSSTSATLYETIKLPVASPPIFSPAAGTYAPGQLVTLSHATKGATIYYTTDGTAPKTTSTKYSGAIKLAKTTKIEAIAVAAGYTNSIVASAKYSIAPAAPTPKFTPAAGAVPAGQVVTISDAASAGLIIYYTTNGDPPTTSSTRYTSAGITVTAAETIKAIATATSYSQSAPATAKYSIK